MAFIPCPGCAPTTTAPVQPSTTTVNFEQKAPVEMPVYEASPEDIVDAQGEAPLDDAGGGTADAEGAEDYVITWDRPDTSKEKLGLAIAGGLAFLAPFVGFAVAAKVARGGSGYAKPIGAGALTFFAMRAAAVGVLHLSDNLPAVTAPTALGAVLPPVPNRHYAPRAVGRAPCRGCR